MVVGNGRDIRMSPILDMRIVRPFRKRAFPTVLSCVMWSGIEMRSLCFLKRGSPHSGYGSAPHAFRYSVSTYWS